MKNLVLYHDSCNDGFCAAWLWRRHVTEDAEFRAVQYGQPAPANAEIVGRNVVILDFSYSRADMKRIKETAGSLLCLDHHKTAQAALAGLDYCWFDMEKSGAMLTWEYLHSKGLIRSANAAIPWLVLYTEDRDLWRWKLPYSKEISAALSSLPRIFAEWDKLDEHEVPVILPDRPGSLAREGAAILRYQAELVSAKTDKSKVRYGCIGGYMVPVVNATCLLSEIAGDLAQDEAFAACFFVISHKEVVYSLRSRGAGGVDVAEIAKGYGGGGHKNASGFTVDHIIEMVPLAKLVPSAAEAVA